MKDKNKMAHFSTSLPSQNGVVLVVSLVFLVALTAVAAALMQNSTTDMKMSGASEEKVIAVQEVVSAIDEVIFNQATTGVNLFARSANGEDNFPIIDQDALLPGTSTSSTARVDVSNNPYGLDVACPRLRSASSTGTFKCNILNINANRAYGRTGLSNVSVDSGIAQQLLQ